MWNGNYACSTLRSTDLINKMYIRHGAYLKVKKITIITHSCLLSEAYVVNVTEVWGRDRREPKVVREHIWGLFQFLGIE